MHIGPYRIDPPLILAPMAGVTDRPFRVLCRRLGAGLAVSEMTSSNPALWDTDKSRLRRDHAGEPGPISVQIAGHDPQQLAEAARFNVDHGAQIIDINMGCPAKKVCRVDAGSALLGDEARVRRICAAVVRAVDVPVTLKIRTGLDPSRRNGVTIARIAEDHGIAALSVHGRTRADRFEGAAEHDTLAAIRDAVRLPLIANGDIDTPRKAAEVLRHTGADALMIARAAQGRPWIFREIARYLAAGNAGPPPTADAIRAVLESHLDDLYAFYGEARGLRVARKHIRWYCDSHPNHRAFWSGVTAAQTALEQRRWVLRHFEGGPWMAAA